MQQASGAHEYAGMGEVNPQFVGARGTSSAHAHGHMIGISQEMPDHSHPEHLQQQQQLLQYSHSSQPHRHEQQKTDTLSEIPSPIASRPPPRASTNSFEGAVGSALGSHEDQEAVAVEDIGERSGSAGNRWPRQETLALLKIRSEMDSAFRDATLKGPLWVDVSRKLAELGYYRSAKKCKEKFENVHKYYKRTKDGRAGRQDGKSYRFFSQLEALHGNNNSSSNANIANTTGIGSTDHAIVIGNELADMRGGGVGGAAKLQPPPPAVLSNNNTKTGGLLNRNNCSTSTNPLLLKHCADSSACISFSSESSEDEEDYDDAERDNHIRKRKRGSSTQKMMIFFENLMRQVMEKQEIMQQKFLQTIEKREQDRMIREEAWKRQEMARLNREHEIMAHERALSASRDAAFIAFLQKITGQTFQQADVSLVAPQTSNFHENVVHESQAELSAAFDPNSTRWPKPEVLALIKLRSGMEARYQDAGPKSPLWEEISAGMNRLGFNRSAKRCKEKWENINKYFKKVKESNKKRPEDAKTCPYFHQLDQLYRKRILGTNSNSNASANKLQSDHHTLQEEIIDQQFPRGSNANNPEDKSTDQGQGHGNSDDILVTMPPPPPSSDDNNNNNNNNSCAAASSIIPSSNGALPTFYSHPETNAGTGADDQRALKKVKMKPQNVIIDPNFNMSTTTSCASLPDLMSFDHGGKDFTVSTNSESVLKPECLNVMEIMDLADNNIPSTQHQQSILADDYEHDDEMILADDDSNNNLDDSDHHPTEEETHQRTHFHHLPFGRFVHDRATEPFTHSTRNTTNSFPAMVRNRFSPDRPEFKSSKA